MIGTTAAIAHRGIGLTTLLHAGVPRWLRAVGTCVRVAHGEATPTGREGHAPVPMSPGLTPSVMPPAQSTEAARLIASLVLSAHAGHGSLRVRQGVSP
jgi:hypothetical protein